MSALAVPKKPKKKTILRVKRKFSDIQPNTIVLQEHRTKRRRTIPWNELVASFNTGFDFNNNNNIKNDNQNDIKDDNKNDIADDINKDNANQFNFQSKATKIPSFFDYDKQYVSSNKRVFRLISSNNLKRSFQQTNFTKRISNNRKLNTLNKRKQNRQNYLKNVKNDILKNNNNNIIQHDDDDDDDDDNNDVLNKDISYSSNTKSDLKSKKVRKSRLDALRNKLKEKQKNNRQTIIATKKQLKKKQLMLNKKYNNNNGVSSQWINDCNNHLISTKIDGNSINIRNVLNNKYFGKYNTQKGINITDMKDDVDNDDDIDIIDLEFDGNKYKRINRNDKNVVDKDVYDYDYYEIDPNCDPKQIKDLMKMCPSQQKKDIDMDQQLDDDDDNDDCSDSDSNDDNDNAFDKKIDLIKNKHKSKLYSMDYGCVTYGFNDKSKKGEIARYISYEIDDLADASNLNNFNDIQTYHENQIIKENDVEKDDENYIDNDYPDEHEFSDDDNRNNENDYWYNYDDNDKDNNNNNNNKNDNRYDDDQYNDYDNYYNNNTTYNYQDQSTGYDDNALNIDFFQSL